MGTYFGTDGIRGVAGETLTPEFALRVGRAAAVAMTARRGPSPRFLVCRDTRLSGPALEAALTAGIGSGGGVVETVGVLPTPGLAALVLQRSADAGVVISASHNPFADNGIKFFNSEGRKLSDDEEAEIEELLAADPPCATGAGFGRSEPLDGAAELYVDGLLSRLEPDLRGVHVAVDCANGAMTVAAPRAFVAVGADVTCLCCEPDGLNINAGCGSTHTELLQEVVRADGYDLGLAFDGDGDRVLAVDRDGGLVDGDFVIAILARHLRSEGRLRGDTVVTTVMTNLGFHHAMEREGIAVKVTDVGDRYVTAEMLAGDYVLGGEQSGHIIDHDVSTTGDGLATALLLLEALRASGLRLDEAASFMERLPQRLANIAVRDRDELPECDAVWSAVEIEQQRLDGTGRVLVRPSGTEPLVRVMVEAPHAEECDDVVERLSMVVREHLA